MLEKVSSISVGAVRSDSCEAAKKRKVISEQSVIGNQKTRKGKVISLPYVAREKEECRAYECRVEKQKSLLHFPRYSTPDTRFFCEWTGEGAIEEEELAPFTQSMLVV